MTTYATYGPTSLGHYIIGYPTPGAPHVLTAAGVASTKAGADEECARRNEAQVAEQRASLARRASLFILDAERP